MATQRLDLSSIKYNLANFRLHWLDELEEWKEAHLTGEEQKAAPRYSRAARHAQTDSCGQR